MKFLMIKSKDQQMGLIIKSERVILIKFNTTQQLYYSIDFFFFWTLFQT